MEGAGLTLRVAPPRCEDFQVNFDVLDSLVDENTAAILINSPNNPSGTAYSAETLTKLAAYLKKKSAEYGHHIFLISDEPTAKSPLAARPSRTPLNSTMIRLPATPSPRV